MGRGQATIHVAHHVPVPGHRFRLDNQDVPYTWMSASVRSLVSHRSERRRTRHKNKSYLRDNYQLSID